MSKVLLRLATLTCVLWGTQLTIAQELRAPNLEQPRLLGRQAKTDIGNAPVYVKNLVEDELIPSLARISRVASTKYSEPSISTRGVKEAAIYRSISPSVVMIFVKDGLGSGTLITGTGQILTNWHVIKGHFDVEVVFKPTVEGKTPTHEDMRRGHVILFDEATDLALVQVDSPPIGRTPVKLGNASDIIVGMDVHAIGHPSGEAWTYTKGVISQYRQNYEWTYDDKSNHKGDVIQTQTPINPGNSGGPLISESGTIIGVNSFEGQGEGLNYAVSVDEIQRLLGRLHDQSAGAAPERPSKKSECESKLVRQGRTDDKTGRFEAYDTKCTGKIGAVLEIPDDKSQPIKLSFDRNADNKVDTVIEDFDQDGKWNISFWDTDFDRKFDLVGYHPDGNVKPSSYESYEVFQQRLAKK